MPRKFHTELEAPDIHLVSPAPVSLELPSAPTHLSEQMQRWWREVVEGFELDAHHLKILEAAADSWDRMVQARETLQREGLTVTTKHGTKKHPAADIERDNKALFARLIRELDLDEPTPPPARYVPPPSLRSNRRR